METRDLAYFDQDVVWESDLDPWEVECAELITALWPADANSLLDAGCGAGRLLNRLDLPILKVGTDFAVTALHRVAAPVAASSMTALPVRDNGFDLTLCSNVLEHLEQSDLPLACAELERVSAKYIMVVSPIDEPMETQLTYCRRCACQFHPNGHRRSFAVADFERMMPCFETMTVRFYGDGWLRMPPLAGAIERATGADLHFYPGATCPNCGHVASPDEAPAPGAPSTIEAMTKAARWLIGIDKPASAIILLRRRSEVRQEVRRSRDEADPNPRARKHAVSVDFAAEVPSRVVQTVQVGVGEADLGAIVAYTPVAIASRGKLVATADNGWQEPAIAGPDGGLRRWLRAPGEKPVEGIVAFSASVVARSGQLSISYEDHSEIPIDVSIFDGIAGYLSLGKLAGANDGEMRRAEFKVPLYYLPQRETALLRLGFSPGRAGRRVLVHRIGFDLAESVRAAEIAASYKQNEIGTPFASVSETLLLTCDDSSMSVSLDASLLGCRSGRIACGSGSRVEVPVWAPRLCLLGKTFFQNDLAIHFRRARIAANIGAELFRVLVAQDDDDSTLAAARERIALTVGALASIEDAKLIGKLMLMPDTQAAHSQLTSDNQELRMQIEDLRAQLMIRDDLYARLLDDHNSFQKQAIAANEAQAKLAHAYEVLQVKAADQDAAFVKLTSDYNQAQVKLAVEAEAFARLTDAYEVLQAKAAAQDEVFVKLTSDYNQAQVKLAEEAEAFARLTDAYEVLQAKAAAQDEVFAKLTDAYDEVQAKLAEVAEARGRLTLDRQALEKRLAAVEALLGEHADALTEQAREAPARPPPSLPGSLARMAKS